MASGNSSGGDGTQRLKADASALRQEAHASGGIPSLEEQQEQLRMQLLLTEQLRRPATINSIEIHGAKNTRKSFFNPLLEPLVDPSRNVGTTLGDVLEGIKELNAKLARFDIFKPEPTVYLAGANERDPGAAVGDLDISIRLAEASRIILKTGTDLGNTEGSAYGNLLWRNVFGGAESLSVSASLGTRTRSAYSATLSTPINSNPDLRASVEALSSTTQKPWASHEEVFNGGKVKLDWLSGASNLHSLAYSGAWRQLTGLTGAASPTVRDDAGDTFKHSLAHTFVRDQRDNPMLPQNGYYFRTINELAGWGPLGGDVSFAKSEVDIAGALPIPLPGVSAVRTGISVGAGFRMGVLYPLASGFSLGGPAQPSRINDRFQLGGPTDVRGFTLGGLGPHDGRDAVGGDVFAAAGVNMLLPLPRAGPASPLRLQLFANGGRLVALKNKGKGKDDGTGGREMDAAAVRRGVGAALSELGNGLPSTAVGVGLVYAHPVARFELNFSLPLVLRRGEEARKGLQVGVGISFL